LSFHVLKIDQELVVAKMRHSQIIART